jgi:hypothetical protein
MEVRTASTFYFLPPIFYTFLDLATGVTRRSERLLSNRFLIHPFAYRKSSLHNRTLRPLPLSFPFNYGFGVFI